MSIATPRQPSLLRRLMFGIAFFIAFVVIGCIILLVLQNTVWNTTNASLQVLHKSTFSNITNNADEVTMLFADGTHVLVADNIWRNRRLYLVDLVTARRTEISLPTSQQLNMREFVYGGDVVYAIYSDEDFKPVAFRITTSGQIAELPVIEYFSRYLGQEPPRSVALEEARERGDLVGLTALEKELCSMNGADEATVKVERQIVSYFVNDRVVINSSLEAMQGFLQQTRFPTISNSCTMHLAPTTAGYRVEVERTPVQDVSRASALDARFTSVALYRGAALVETLTFSHPNDFYFRTAFVGDRLYLLGANVSYIELGAG
jgi:hypothetical protein